MGRATTDPLVDALASVDRPKGGARMLLPGLFKDRPAVLEAVRDARRRGVSFETIASRISAAENVRVSANAVRNYLRSVGDS